MMVPLYNNAPPTSASSSTGLIFDKFFGAWDLAFLEASLAEVTAPNSHIQKFGTSAKLDWIKRLCQRTATPELRALLAEAIARQKTLIEALGGEVWYAVATSRFVTGTGIANPLENGFAFHHTLGVPYLTASGVKGATRNYALEWHAPYPHNDLEAWKKDINRLLGSPDVGVGAVILFDMLPVAPPKLVPEIMTPHYGDWYQTGAAPGDWMSPVPIPFLAVEAGAVFQFGVAPRVLGDPVWPATKATLIKFLTGTLEITGLGAKTAVGYGRFTFAQGNYWRGDTLAAGTKLFWPAASENGEHVVTLENVVLTPDIEIPVQLQNGEQDSPHISSLAELKHIT